MALNRTMRGLLRKEWTSQMVRNSHAQERGRHLVASLNDENTLRYTVDVSQRWVDTPQGRPYWERIRDSL
jgi:hypothetical protein